MLTEVFFTLIGKRDYGSNPKKRGGEARGKEKKGNCQTGAGAAKFLHAHIEKRDKSLQICFNVPFSVAIILTGET